MSDLTISDTLIILATLASPMVAVQVQKFIERATERRKAQKQIFYDLMATRATRLAPLHVEALNRIDLEFSGSTAKEKAVVDRWRIYADHLNTLADKPTEAQVEDWVNRGDDLFTDLLEALATALGYSFNRVQLKRGIYRPRAHNEAEYRQELIHRSFLAVMTGHSPLKMEVTGFPVDDQIIELQKKVHEGMLNALEDGAVRIKKA